MDLSEKLLALAAAVKPDGGDEVVRLLRRFAGEVAPFDAGEIVLRREGRLARWSLEAGGEGPIAGEDLLDHLRLRGSSVRFDTRGEAEGFPRTHEQLKLLGLESLLALPLDAEAARTGALVLARGHGWAFVGASLPTLLPLAGMAGLALERALALTSWRERTEALEAAAGPEAAALAHRNLAAAREALEAARQAAAEEGSGREAAVRRAEEAEAALKEVQRQADLLRNQCESARAEAALRAEERDRARVELAARGDDLAARRAEGEVTLARLRAREEELLASSAAHTRLETELREQGERAAAQASELAILRAELTALREEAGSWTGLKAGLDQERGERERFEAEGERLRRELLSAQEALMALEAQAVNAGAALEAERRRGEELLSHLQETTTAREVLDTAVEQQAGRLDELEGALKRAQEEVALLRERHAQAEARAEGGEAALASALARSRELEAALGQAAEDSRTLSLRVERLRARARAAAPSLSLRRARASKGKPPAPRRPARGRG